MYSYGFNRRSSRGESYDHLLLILLNSDFVVPPILLTVTIIMWKSLLLVALALLATTAMPTRASGDDAEKALDSALLSALNSNDDSETDDGDEDSDGFSLQDLDMDEDSEGDEANESAGKVVRALVRFGYNKGNQICADRRYRRTRPCKCFKLIKRPLTFLRKGCCKVLPKKGPVYHACRVVSGWFGRK